MAPSLKRTSRKSPKLIKISSFTTRRPPSKVTPVRNKPTFFVNTHTHTYLHSQYENPLIFTPFPDLDKYSDVSDLLSLIQELASRIWAELPDPKNENAEKAAAACSFLAKPYIREMLSFQSGVPASTCVPKTLLMGTKIGTENPTSMERELARLAEQGLIWILSVDARDVKEIIVLKSGMLEKLNTLCNDNPDQTNIGKEEHAVITKFFGGSPKNMENNDIYCLFKEFLLSHGKALRYVTRSHFIEFEQSFLENRDMDTPDEAELKQRLSNYKDDDGHCALWEHRSLLISSGYLTLVLEANNTGTVDEAETSFGESGSFRCAAVVSSSSDMNGITVDDDTQLQNFNKKIYEKEIDLVFRLSLPNVGALLSTIRVTRKWILDTIMNRRRSSGDHNATIAPVAASSRNNFRQLTQPMLFEKWTVKQRTAAFYYKFKGINLEYALEEAYGGGWIEPFKTPAGVCWKYTGKTVSV